LPEINTQTPDPHFSEALCQFIQTHLPSIEAMEILLFLHRDGQRAWPIDALTQAMQSSGVSRALAAKQLDAYQTAGLVVATEDGYRYQPAAPETAALVDALATAHKERPVSLIRLIYYLRAHKIQSFADAFRMKKD
jgi:hypothetical protein